MPEFSPDTLSGSDSDFIAKLNAMFIGLQTAINTHHQELLISVGAGAALVVDEFDREGIVGAYSYQLDFDNYAGAGLIDIGRRPVAVPLQGDADISIAWGDFGAGKVRVFQSSDVTLNATAFATGLPKTIYVGVGAAGSAQFYEDTTDPNILYLYSVTWDGFTLDSWKRLVPILPGYTFHQEMAGEPRLVDVDDHLTDWVTPGILASETKIVTLGDPLDNAIGVNGQVEVVGFLLHAWEQGDDGWNAPAHNPPDSLVTLRVRSAGVTWSKENIEIDCGQVPDSIFVEVDPAIGDLKYVNEVRRFDLELVSVGSGVTSARGFTWAAVTRPIIGSPVAKDGTTVGLV
jgi:hypothetical protein